ncbi:hypothetical protein Bca52824_085333 [Brassica carinata]|uniref:Uncharacterized protein n=1 Tax=Brassica carinata TaxID=52824 RepID=A0A8X7P6X3_BRACI|nr:hypothetical protein Bca52824_085333 [Brassica carinata]
MEGLLRFLVAKVILLALASSFVSCYDPSPLQDFCVAVDDVNGECIGLECEYKIYREINSDDPNNSIDAQSYVTHVV